VAETGKNIKNQLWRIVRPIRRTLIRYTRRPAVDGIDWGHLRRLEPVSRDWGFDRGQPIDRHYIEAFLAANRADIKGHVLEVAGDDYTQQFGGTEVQCSDVLDVMKDNPRATIVADLTNADDLKGERFDCIICTQTLQFIFDIEAALATLYRLLRHGGILLLTVPGITPISREDMAKSGDYWRFTDASIRRLLSRTFPDSTCCVQTYGNVLASTAFLQGIASNELRTEELSETEPQFPLLVAVRAVKGV
jgi:SAM-dependent methyltransferase